MIPLSSLNSKAFRQTKEALWKGHYGRAAQVLEQYPSLLGAHDMDGNTVLSAACLFPSGRTTPARRAKHLNFLADLLEKGMPVEGAGVGEPFYRPLRRALEFFPPAVPLLLAAGARPQADVLGTSYRDCSSDLIRACERCPEHVPALLEAGASLLPGGEKTPLGALLKRCRTNPPLRHEPARPELDALQALLNAGVVPQGTVEGMQALATPDWFEVWPLLFQFSGDPWHRLHPAFEEGLKELIARAPNPGLRSESGTFLHALTSRYHNNGVAWEQAWDHVEATYSPDQLRQWASWEGSAPQQDHRLPLSILLRQALPRESGGREVRASESELVEALENAIKAFDRLARWGMDINAATAHGNTAAHVLIQDLRGLYFHARGLLKNERLWATLQRAGLDLSRKNKKGISGIDALLECFTDISEKQECKTMLLATGLPNANRVKPRLRF